VRRWGEELDADALAVVTRIAQIDDAAFLIFLNGAVGEHQDRASLHIMLQINESAVGIYDHGLAGFVELAPVFGLAGGLQRDAEENALAAPARLVGRRIHAAMLSPRGAASIAALAPCVLGATALSDRCFGALAAAQGES